MEIAICDDEKLVRQQLREMLIQYKHEKNICINIYEFESAKTLLNSPIMFDIVFMDYQMPLINGIDAARSLKRLNPICSTIFITSYPEKCILEAFTVETFRFIIKPINPSLIYDALNCYIRQQKLLKPLVIINNGEMKTIHSKDIIYLEGDGKYCWVRTTTSTEHSSKTLSQVYSALPSHCFCRIHKSYVINLYCVSSIQNNTVVLTNGEKATICRSKVAEFKGIYKNFVKNYYVGT